MQRRRSWRVGLFAAVLALLPALAAAQGARFRANLDGTQEVPPTVSTAVGFGRVTLNGSETVITVSLTFSGLSSNQIAAHIHGPAGPGGNAPVIFDIGSQGATSGTFTALIFAVTPQQVADLRNGLWYFNVHSANFFNGEIRGQIMFDSPFIANLSGVQEVPSNGSAGVGIATATINNSGALMYVSLTFQGLGSNQTASHVHGGGMPGVNAGILFDIGSSGATAGDFPDRLFSLTLTQQAQLRSGLFYINVHSVNFSNGEIRGQLKPANKVTDFDADSRAEVGVFRPGSSSIWYMLNHVTNAFTAVAFGTSSDTVTPGDTDADGKTDVTVWRPFDGTFYTLRSRDGSLAGRQWGTFGDDPRVIADYDGDGHADFAVWRQTQDAGEPAVYHILQSANGVYRPVTWGLTFLDVTVSGDYDGDRVADLGVYRTGPGIYYILRSTLGFLGQQFGVSATDTLVPGDYDGDEKTDLAVFRTTTGIWYIWQSSTGTLRSEAFGLGSDSPVPADFDGDGKTDLAVTRTSGGAYTWYILQSSTGTLKAVGFGAAGDIRLTNYLVR